MEIKIETKNRITDSDYIYELFKLPELDEKAIEEAKNSEDVSLIVGVIDYESFEYHPTFLLGVYVITELGDKAFVSKEDPVYEGPYVELGRFKARYRAREMAAYIARSLESDIPAISSIRTDLLDISNARKIIAGCKEPALL